MNTLLTLPCLTKSYFIFTLRISLCVCVCFDLFYSSLIHYILKEICLLSSPPCSPLPSLSPNTLLLHFPSEKSRLLRGINQIWHKRQQLRLCTYTYIKDGCGNLVGRKGFPKHAKGS